MPASNPPPRLRLPIQPSLEHLKKQAKRRAKSDALQLAEAQHRLAVDYGFASWPKLVAHVESLLVTTGDWHSGPNDNLPKAANAGAVAKVLAILASGQYAQPELDLALGRVVCGMGNYSQAERWTIADALLAAGADPDGDYGGNYGPIVFGACEGIDFEGIKWLVDHGADVSFAPIDTKYGKACPLSHLLGTYMRGKNDAKHKAIELLFDRGVVVPPEVTPEVLAIHRGDAIVLGEMIDKDRTLLHRRFPDMPYGNINLAGATLLHCAVEFGELECIDAILSRYRGKSDLDINSRADVIDGVGGQTPLYHAINTNGDRNFYTLEYLVGRVGQYIDMSVKATWRSYGQPQTTPLTPLEYAEKAEREIDPKWAHYKPRVKEELAILRKLDRTYAIKAAIRTGDVAQASRLLDAHPELLTPELWPPSYQAKSVEMTRLLLDRGLDPNVSSAPRRAIDLACYHALPEIVELLIARGADVTGRNKLGETPMDLLEAYEPRAMGDPDARRVREALIKAGATHDIHSAVRSGDVEEVRRMLDTDPSVVHSENPWNPLFTAARAGRVEVARLLLDRGANVNGTNEKGNTPLWFACQSPANPEDRIAVAKLLLDARADVHRRCEDGTTALHFAAWRGPIEMVKLLLDHKARTWIADDKGQSPADHAKGSSVNADKDKIVSLLTEVQFDDPLFKQAVAAIDAGDVEGLKRLLAEHPHLVTTRLKDDSAITRGYFTEPTLLHFVANNPNRHPTMPPRILESTQAILDAGAEVDAKTPHENGGTTLALVASSEPAKQAGMQVPLIELLVRNGARPLWGLEAAIMHRYVDAVRALLHLGAPLTLTTAAGLGETVELRKMLQARPNGDPQPSLLRAGWAAALNGHADSIDALVAAGLNVSTRLPRPFEPTMLHEAAWHNHRDVVARLLHHGADPTIRDTQYNATPAGWAHEAKHPELAALLFAAEQAWADKK